MNLILFTLLTFNSAHKFLISPKDDHGVALSLTSLKPHVQVFNFVGKLKIDQRKTYCIAPLVMPNKNGSHSLYFCGSLMCLKNGALETCSFAQRAHSEFEFERVTDLYRIKQKDICLASHRSKLYLEKCDESEGQLFNVQKVEAPRSDNFDVDYQNRADGIGNKEMIRDQTIRQLSQIKYYEMVEEIVQNDFKDGVES